jgi:uncharacterized protein (TIGR02145 family)
MCKQCNFLFLAVIAALVCLTGTIAYGDYVCGDANGDSDVNVSDAVHIINYVFVGGDPPNPIESCDCNCDEACNVSDAVWIINYVFIGGHEPCDMDGDGFSDCDRNCPSTVIDIDGNVYQTIYIGGQCWMAENLKVTHYRNGDPIPNAADTGEWYNTTEGAYCNYENDEGYVDIYGRLYNGYAIYDIRNIAPAGWHVPSDAEWKRLEIYLGMSQAEADGLGYRGTDEGGKLKETGTTHWYSPNTGATNESGFTAVPGGFRLSRNHHDLDFDNMGIHAFFWSAMDYSNCCIWNRNLYYYNSQIDRLPNSMNSGLSVRCVQDRPNAIVLNPTPDSIQAPWSLMGPDGPVPSGNGNDTLAGLIPGDYTLSWGHIWGWIAPPDSTITLPENDTITFVGSYVEGPWPDSTGTVTDIDGNIYKTVKIGDQWWMAENLKVTRYRNGDSIPNVTGNSGWVHLSTGAYCEYDNDPSNVSIYGRLYNWYAVDDSRNIAPEGWHMPGDAELKQLEIYLGMSQIQADTIDWRGTDEGGKLKAAGTMHWIRSNTGATNKSGFTALPAGYRNIWASFRSINSKTAYWSSSEGDSAYTWARYLYYCSSQVFRGEYDRRFGFSIRCIRD